MRLEVKEEPEKVKIQKIEFICDGGIHPKLDKYEFSRHGFNKHSFSFVVGRPQSGKSNWTQNMFKNKTLLRKCFHNIFYVCPSSSSLKDDIFNKLPEDKRFMELNEETLQSILARCEASEKDEKNMIVIDDCASALKDHNLLKAFQRLIFNRRHVGGGVSVIIIAQNFNLLPLQLRKVINNLILFKPTFNEFELINDELLNLPKKELKKVMNFFFDERFNFMMVNLDTGKYFKNFDPVELHEDADENNI
jgi:hypothetical protein